MSVDPACTLHDQRATAQTAGVQINVRELLKGLSFTRSLLLLFILANLLANLWGSCGNKVENIKLFETTYMHSYLNSK